MPRRKTRHALGKPTSGSVVALVKRLTAIDALLAGDLPRPVCQSEGRFKRLYVQPIRGNSGRKRKLAEPCKYEKRPRGQNRGVPNFHRQNRKIVALDSLVRLR